uniref:Histone H3.v1-like n=1 Tax=Nicotiana tabacum TaxID=4097 RepID=A0A1S4BWP4_TOBAC|nr:PREDICTED: histone H3.v1-like [Nicotiana tabacum]
MTLSLGDTNEAMCKEFAEMMGNEFEMSMMDELNFFLGLFLCRQEMHFRNSSFSRFLSGVLGNQEAKISGLIYSAINIAKNHANTREPSTLTLDITFSETMLKRGISQLTFVQYPPSKLDGSVSTIDVSPLNTLPPISEKPPVEKFTVEKGAGDLGKETEDEEDDGVEREEEVVNNHEEHDAQNIANEEEKSENEGESGDKTGEQANDSAEEENQSEEEEVYESEGEDQEKVSESEGGDEESEEEEEGNPLQKTRAQEPRSRLTPFTGDEEVSSNEDDVPLFEIGKKSRKTPVKATKSAVSTRK